MALVPGVFWGCAPEQVQHDALERARADGLRVGFSTEPPYAFVDSAGEPTGEAPVMLRHAARELGIAEIQWFPLPFHDLMPALLAGRVDVIASGLFVTPERSQRVAFSLPTTCVRPVLVTRRSDSIESRRTSGYECDGCRIAVIEGSVEQRALEPEKGMELIRVPDLATAVVAISRNRADGFAISAPTGREIVRRRPGLVVEEDVLPERVTQEAGGCAALAFRPQDAELRVAFDSVLRHFVGSPEHLELVSAFGFTERELSTASSQFDSPEPQRSRAGNRD